MASRKNARSQTKTFDSVKLDRSKVLFLTSLTLFIGLVMIHEYSCEFGHRTARNRYKPNDREDKSDEGTVSWSVTHNRYLDMWLTQNEFEKNNIAFVNMIIWCEIGP